MGAVGGAFGGAIGQLGVDFLGSFGNSWGYEMLSGVGTNAATSAIYGDQITWNSLIGNAAGSLGGALIGNTPGKYSNSLFRNSSKEILFNTGKGAFTGLLSGSVRHALGDPKEIIFQSMVGGAVNGGVNSALKNIVFGSPIDPELTNKVKNNPDAMKLFDKRTKPLFRSGGLSFHVQNFLSNTFDIDAKRSFVYFDNIMMRKGQSSEQGHELYHFYQQFHLSSPYSSYSRLIFEQLFIFDPYFTPNKDYLEYEAQHSNW